MTYTYEITEGPLSGTTFEVEQSIKEAAFTEYTYEGMSCKVRRVIAGPGAFILKGDCWARTNYERGIQSMPTAEEKANFDKPYK